MDFDQPPVMRVEVGAWGCRPVEWGDLELFHRWRSYLEGPGRYLRHVLDEG